MSCTNCSCVTLRGASRTEWQSTHVFGVCAPPQLTSIKAATKAPPAAATNLFRRESIEAHRNHIRKCKDARAHDPSLAATFARWIEEGKQCPDQSRQAEEQDSKDFSIHEADSCGNQLQGLKHEQEVPLRLNA